MWLGATTLDSTALERLLVSGLEVQDNPKGSNPQAGAGFACVESEDFVAQLPKLSRPLGALLPRSVPQRQPRVCLAGTV